MLKKNPLLILLDGNALVHRAWHAIRQPLTVSSTGEDVRAVYGFLNSFLKTLSDWNPTHCAIAFDVSAPTFRHIEFEDYKAQRPPTPPSLIDQFKRVHQLMEAFNIPIYEVEGYEADDILGTLCKQAEQQEIDTLVLTGDTDTLQLVSPWVKVLLSYGVQNRTVYDVEAVKKRYGGLSPTILPDIKALQGDASDNIPGIPGIGAKTAINILNKFGTLEETYRNIDQVDPPKLQKILKDNKDIAFQGKFLTTIYRNIPIKLDLSTSQLWEYNRSNVISLIRDLEFFSIVSKIPFSTINNEEDIHHITSTPNKTEVTYEIVDTVETLNNLIKSLENSNGFSIDTETTSTNSMNAKLVGISFSTEPGKAWYVPVGHSEGKQLPATNVFEKLRPLLKNERIPKVAHNANYDLTVLSNHDIDVSCLRFDSMLAAHMSGVKAIGLKSLALSRLNHEMTPITDLIGTGKNQITMDQVPISKAANYAAADADFTRQLWSSLRSELENIGTHKLFDEVELPLISVLVRMQLNGVSIDKNLLQSMSEELNNQILTIEKDMHQLIGHEFNLNSSQQLGNVLFDELKLPPTKRTKKGYSTDAASLETLKTILNQGTTQDTNPTAYEVLEKIMEYRQLTKLKSTYVDSLPSMINPVTGRIHTSYNQTGSATGRISSNDPNVQNIPVRSELGRRVRKAFVAKHSPEWILLSADYSQIELRILAHLSCDKDLLEAFNNDEDIHTSTASYLYDTTLEKVTQEMRRIGKVMNFGVLYGLSPYGVSQQTNLSSDMGSKFIAAYFGKYPGIHKYLDETKEKCRKLGYVETILGRRRYIPEINSRNFHIRNAAERAAINMPIQGTAADIIKIAMVNIQKEIDSMNLKSMMILQVHDELIFEVPKEELFDMKRLVMKLMPAAMSLKIPLQIEIKSGHTWGDMF